MVKIPINYAIENLVSIAKANATPIATGSVIIGIITAVILAVKAGKESEEIIEDAKEEYEVESFSFSDVVRLVWKKFIPVIFILGLTIACLLINTNRMMKRYAALSTAYALSESYLKDYMEATKENTGPKKEQAIRDSVMNKQVAKHPLDKNSAERGIIERGNGDILFYDTLTTRYFHDSIEHVKEIERNLAGIYEAEDKLFADDYARELLGINTHFEQMGWKKTGKIDGTHKFKLNYTSGLIENSMTPYVAIYRDNNPLVEL